MNLNKVFILGNLTRDPELRQTPSGQVVCSFSIATNRFFTDSSGQKQKQAEFHNVVAWGRQAEIINQYLRKGSLLMVEGRLQTRSWQDQQNVKHWRTEVIAEKIQLGPRPGGTGGGRENEEEDSNSPSSPSSLPQPEQTPIIELPGEENDSVELKDIPF